MTDSVLLMIVCGWPLAGKSTVAREVSENLGIRLLDIDRDIRVPMFGLPHPHPNTSDELTRRDQDEMRGSYELLWHAVEIYIRLNRHVIACCTLSRQIYQDALASVCLRNPAAKLRIVQCRPQNDGQEEITRRLDSPDRKFGTNCFSSVNSHERYEEVKRRYATISLPHLELDTSPPNTLESCVRDALTYIHS